MCPIVLKYLQQNRFFRGEGEKFSSGFASRVV